MKENADLENTVFICVRYPIIDCNYLSVMQYRFEKVLSMIISYMLLCCVLNELEIALPKESYPCFYFLERNNGCIECTHSRKKL